MGQRAKTVEISQEKGREWFEHQLEQGFDLAEAVLAASSLAGGRFQAFVPSDASLEEINFPRSPDVPGSDLALADWLDEMTSQGAHCVLVEDDVQRRGDPTLLNPAAFLGDRVVHWCNLDARGGKDAAEVVDQGAFGYPLNAFVVSTTAEDLGLVDGEEAPGDLPRKMMSSLVAVIVSVFDATSFATWTAGAQ